METPPKGPFYPLESQRSFERISARIKEAIVDGTLQVGERLPSEAELASSFAVSRQTIREALRTLEQTGFLGAPRKGAMGGTTVQNTIAEAIGGLFVDAINMESVSVDELNVARKAIEDVIVGFAIENADEEDYRLLQENIAESGAQIVAGGISKDADLEFHRLVARASKNPVFEVVADAILCVMQGILARNPPTPTMSQRAVESHKLFLAAMRNRDAELGRKVMLEHLQEVHMYIKDVAES